MVIEPQPIIESTGTPAVTQGSGVNSDTAPHTTTEATEEMPVTTENPDPTQIGPEPALVTIAQPQHWEAATAIQPYTQPQSMPTTTPQIQTDTQPTHRQPPTPLQSTAPTQSTTEAQLAALIQLISHGTKPRYKRNEMKR